MNSDATNVYIAQAPSDFGAMELTSGAVSAPAKVRSPSSVRSVEIDFFRGLGLWVIYVDHIYPNFWSRFTLGHFGFSDFSEVFVFISGFVNAAMYSRALETGGLRAAIRKLSSRMSRFYLVHIATMAFSLVVLTAGLRLGWRLYDPGPYLWMTDAHQYFLRILAMSYAPGLNSLLPLYIVTAPGLLLAVICLRRAPLPTLTASFVIWSADQFHIFDPLVTSKLEGWSFHPFAWQFLFVIGAAIQMYRVQTGRIAKSRPIRVAAIVIVMAALILKGMPLFETGRNLLFHVSLVARIVADGAGKARLAPFRLIHFLSLLLLVSVLLPRYRRWLDSPIAKLAIACGRDSILVFSFALIMTYVVDLLIFSVKGGLAMQLICTVVGVSLMCALSWNRQRSRCPRWTRD
jgi:hypothetical protein